jgi:hypothetical protein
MATTSITQMAERVSQLLGTRYRVSGDLPARIAKVRRQVPARVYGALETLSSAELMAHNPKLAAQIDTEAVAEAYDLALKHLNSVGRWDRRKGTALGIAASIAFSLIVVAVGLVAVLRWRGYI